MITDMVIKVKKETAAKLRARGQKLSPLGYSYDKVINWLLEKTK